MFARGRLHWAPVAAQKLAPGQTVTILAAVVGDSVEGNAHWYRISANTYIWAGACSAAPLPTLPHRHWKTASTYSVSLLWLTFTTAMK
jgi:hypothetical protein